MWHVKRFETFDNFLTLQMWFMLCWSYWLSIPVATPFELQTTKGVQKTTRFVEHPLRTPFHPRSSKWETHTSICCGQHQSVIRSILRRVEISGPFNLQPSIRKGRIKADVSLSGSFVYGHTALYPGIPWKVKTCEKWTKGPSGKEKGWKRPHPSKLCQNA